jgi:hypothetical protein
MVRKEAAAVDAADAWAHATQIALTEILDQQLRHLRPQAGHIDEGLRRDVSSLLLARRRKFEQFIASQVAAANAQVEAFEAEKARAEVGLGKSVAQVENYHRLLRQCQSRAAVAVRKREVERLHDQIAAEIVSRGNARLQNVHASCDKLAEDIGRCSPSFSICSEGHKLKVIPWRLRDMSWTFRTTLHRLAMLLADLLSSYPKLPQRQKDVSPTGS